VTVAGFGRVTLDVAYGGAFYAVLPASRLGLDLRETPTDDLVRAARRVTAAGRHALTVRHPAEPDLGFLYGTILTDDVPPDSDAPTFNLCVFGGGQVDRSPTGSGATARMALDHARGLIGPGRTRRFVGLSGVGFDAEIVHVEEAGAVVRVAGESHPAGEATLVCETGDPLADGLALPERLGDLWGR